ncbi:MAG: aminotransferase class V-fold PLP-dependent enzyme [Deltaproteobacteria bacterium]|nr:aminotransferase class V-fold PLP-dependent enzyme [Deltaproteobacteria bacterium]
MSDIIYFDNAATSWPKPPEVPEAMARYLCGVGGSPGRSGHRLSIEAGRIVLDARVALATILGAADPFQIVFTKNATEALNLALYGLLKPGDHVITSAMEHNSVMRPLRGLEKEGVELTVLACSVRGEFEPGAIEPAIRPNTKAIVLTHASNVTGTILPIAEAGRIARGHGIVLLVDAAQTAGALPIHVADMGIDLLAFTGHKSLFGPPGTGGLYIRPGLETEIRPLLSGGTGSRSEFEAQPDFLPDKFEAGTPNTVGLAGLSAGAAWIIEHGIAEIRAREESLTGRFLAGVKEIPGVTLYGPADPSRQAAVVSFNIEGLMPSEVAWELDERFAILSRPGLHCSPAAHRTIGTFPEGTVRFGFGCFNTEAEIDAALSAIRELAGGARIRS